MEPYTRYWIGGRHEILVPSEGAPFEESSTRKERSRHKQPRSSKTSHTSSRTLKKSPEAIAEQSTFNVQSKRTVKASRNSRVEEDEVAIHETSTVSPSHKSSHFRKQDFDTKGIGRPSSLDISCCAVTGDESRSEFQSYNRGFLYGFEKGFRDDACVSRRRCSCGSKERTSCRRCSPKR